MLKARQKTVKIFLKRRFFVIYFQLSLMSVCVCCACSHAHVHMRICPPPLMPFTFDLAVHVEGLLHSSSVCFSGYGRMEEHSTHILPPVPSFWSVAPVRTSSTHLSHGLCVNKEAQNRLQNFIIRVIAAPDGVWRHLVLSAKDDPRGKWGTDVSSLCVLFS